MLFPADEIERDAYFMGLALDQAANAYEDEEVPVGAIIVLENKVIARAHNQCERLHDPTAHAEMLAITMASEALGVGRLIGTTVYSTIEPCFMCAGALLHARVSRIVFGAKDAKFGACGSIENIVQNSRLNHRVQLKTGVREEECRSLMQEFFKLRRPSKTAQNGQDFAVSRRDARAAEWARLESECRGNPTGGSNPSLSAMGD